MADHQIIKLSYLSINISNKYYNPQKNINNKHMINLNYSVLLEKAEYY